MPILHFILLGAVVNVTGTNVIRIERMPAVINLLTSVRGEINARGGYYSYESNSSSRICTSICVNINQKNLLSVLCLDLGERGK